MPITSSMIAGEREHSDRPGLAVAALVSGVLIIACLLGYGAIAGHRVGGARLLLSGDCPPTAPGVSRELESYRHYFGGLPDQDDLDLVSLNGGLLFGTSTVTLKDRATGAVLRVETPASGEAASVEWTGVAQRVKPSAAEAEEDAPLWQVTEWASEGEYGPAAESVVSEEVSSGVLVRLPAGTEASPAGTDTVSVSSKLPTQYSVLPMPGRIAIPADADLLYSDWLSIVRELAEMTGYEEAGSGMRRVTYQGLPAISGYARFTGQGRTRWHGFLAVFMPQEETVALAVSQVEQRMASNETTVTYEGAADATAAPDPDTDSGIPDAGHETETMARESLFDLAFRGSYFRFPGY